MTKGPTFAILMHPAAHYTSSRQLLGAIQLKSRLLQALGCVVVHIRHDDWNDQRTDEMRQRYLRGMLEPHMGPNAKQELQAAQAALDKPPPPADPRAAACDPRAAACDPRAAACDPRAGLG